MGSTPPGYAFRGPGLDRSELMRERPDDLRARWAHARVLVVDIDASRPARPAPRPMAW